MMPYTLERHGFYRVITWILILDRVAQYQAQYTPDPLCGDNECKELDAGYQACITDTGEIKGCTGDGRILATKDGYVQDASCTTPCQETRNGLVICLDPSGTVKGCLAATPDTSTDQDASVSVPSTLNESLLASHTSYTADPSCTTSCQSNSQGFVYCTTSGGRVVGCLGAMQDEQAALSGYKPHHSCNSECKSYGGYIACSTLDGAIKGCTFPQNASTQKATFAYIPDSSCTNECQKLQKTGLWGCLTSNGQIRGCTSAVAVLVPKAKPYTNTDATNSTKASAVRPAAGCITECKNTLYGRHVCLQGNGTTLECTPGGPTLWDTYNMSAGGDRPPTSLRFIPDDSCTTACEQTEGGFMICYTDIGDVRGCMVTNVSSIVPMRSTSGGGTNTGAIVGGILGAIAGIMLVTVAIILYRKMHKRPKSFQKFQDSQCRTISLGYTGSPASDIVDASGISPA